MKRLLFALLAVCLLSLAVSAEEWFIEDGDIALYTVSSQQVRVTQGDKTAVEECPTITQRDPQTPCANTITSTGGAERSYAMVNWKNLNLENFETNPVTVKHSIKFHLIGENTIRAHGEFSCVRPVMATPGFESEEGGLLRAYADRGAALGSNAGEDLKLQSSVTVFGAEIYCESDSGAGIGTGEGGDLCLEINFTENANVTAVSRSGAGVGTGKGGSFKVGGLTFWSGTVRGSSQTGAGIGSGEDGNIHGSGYAGSPAAFMNIWEGSHLIGQSQSGAGVGSGRNGEFDTLVLAVEGEVEASSVTGAGLGTGENGSISKINDLGFGSEAGNSRIIASSQSGAAIGTGKGGNTDCWNFNVGGYVEAESVTGAAIGTGEGGNITNGVGVRDTAEVTARSQSGAGIGTGKNGSILGGKNDYSGVSVSGVVNAASVSGAAIGTGESGEVAPETNVWAAGLEARIQASSESGAAIGTGKLGRLGGDVVVNGNVDAVSVSGAAIGTGEGGKLEETISNSNAYGQISVEYNVDRRDLPQYITAVSQSGAAVGTGKGGDANGRIYVSTDLTAASVSGAAIGTGENGSLILRTNKEETILLDGGYYKENLVKASSESGAAVGTGKNGDFNGYAWVMCNLELSSVSGAGIGSGEGGNMYMEPGLKTPWGEQLYNIMLSSQNADAPQAVVIRTQTGAAIGTGAGGTMEGFVFLPPNLDAVTSAEGMQTGAGKDGTLAEDLDMGDSVFPRFFNGMNMKEKLPCQCGNTVLFTVEEAINGAIVCDQCGFDFSA